MKKHTHLIRLIVLTAGLIGLGIIAFQYLQKEQNIVTKIKEYTELEKETKPRANTIDTTQMQETIII